MSNMNTGQKTNYSGLSVDEQLFLIEGEESLVAEAYSGQRIALKLVEVTGFNEKNGKVIPGMTLTVLSPDGNVFLESDDLFADTEGFLADDLVGFTATWTVDPNTVVGQTYTVKSRVWDKEGKGEATTEVPLKIIAAPVQ